MQENEAEKHQKRRLLAAWCTATWFIKVNVSSWFCSTFQNSDCTKTLSWWTSHMEVEGLVGSLPLFSSIFLCSQWLLFKWPWMPSLNHDFQDTVHNVSYNESLSNFKSGLLPAGTSMVSTTLSYICGSPAQWKYPRIVCPQLGLTPFNTSGRGAKLPLTVLVTIPRQYF